jgi:2-polyprenyl-3-methyl-5-hydroxy-6-metoxy-1,4-benzoquinol methylase
VLHPVPEDLSAYYAGGYHVIPRSLDELRPTAEADRYKLDMVLRFTSKGRLLEIGPGIGAFAYLAKEAGFEVHGVEIDDECCRFLNDVVGIQAIHVADPRLALRPPASYDVIALWHVIEHLPDPWGVIEAAAACLRPGGFVVIATPNPESLQFQLFARFWTHLDAPRHLELIPSAALIRRAKLAGLSVALLTSTDHGGLGWNRFGWQGSFRNLLRRLLPDWLTQLMGRTASRLARPVERRGMRGSTYTVVLTREASA